jgi:hypothetical protein
VNNGISVPASEHKTDFRIPGEGAPKPQSNTAKAKQKGDRREENHRRYCVWVGHVGSCGSWNREEKPG